MSGYEANEETSSAVSEQYIEYPDGLEEPEDVLGSPPLPPKVPSSPIVRIAERKGSEIAAHKQSAVEKAMNDDYMLELFLLKRNECLKLNRAENFPSTRDISAPYFQYTSDYQRINSNVIVLDSPSEQRRDLMPMSPTITPLRSRPSFSSYDFIASSPSSLSSSGSGSAYRNWNEELQSLLEHWQQAYDHPHLSLSTPRSSSSDSNTEMLLRIAASIDILVNDFIKEATKVAKKIVQERQLPVQCRTIKTISIGGIAGGDKYKYNSMILKFPCEKGLYGDDRYAAKSARHELLGFNALQLSRMFYHTMDHDEDQKKYPCFPLCVLIKYAGSTVLALSELPINAKTILHGSSDGGEIVHDDAQVRNLAQNMLSRLKLKGHFTGKVKKSFIYGPADLEIHHGEDSRYYFIDPARLFPPLRPTSGNHPGQFLYRHFRPEFLRDYNQPLSSDSFSEFQVEGAEKNNEEITKATAYLIKTTIPEFVNEMSIFYRSLYENKPIPFDSKNVKNFLLQMHVYGINCEFLSKIYHQLASVNQPLQHLVLKEMLSRVMKNDIFTAMRRQALSQLKDRLYSKKQFLDTMKTVVVGKYNDYFKSTPDTINTWKKFETELALGIDVNLQSQFDLNDLIEIFVRLQELTGIQIIDIALDRPFVITDVLKIKSLVKTSYAFSYVMGFALCEKATQLVDNSEEARSYFDKAVRSYEKALMSYPADWIAFCNHSAALTHLSISLYSSDNVIASLDLIKQADLHASHAFKLNKNSARVLTNWAVVLKTMAEYHFKDQASELYSNAIAKLTCALDIDFKDPAIHENLALVLLRKALCIRKDSTIIRLLEIANWHIRYAIALDSSPTRSKYVNSATIALIYAKKLQSHGTSQYPKAIALCQEAHQNLLKVAEKITNPNVLYNWGELLLLEATMATELSEASESRATRMLEDACVLFQRISFSMPRAMQMKKKIEGVLKSRGAFYENR